MNEPSAVFEIIHSLAEQPDGHLSVSEMCSIAGVSRSGYYAWIKATPVREAQEEQDRRDFDGAAHWPAGKCIPAHARINAPNPPTGDVSIRNLTGTCVFTRQLPGVRGNTQKFIKTAHPANG